MRHKGDGDETETEAAAASAAAGLRSTDLEPLLVHLPWDLPADEESASAGLSLI